jgi:hypothetical protein
VPTIKLENFGGMLPVKDERLLPDNFAANADGTWLYGSALRGFNPAVSIRTLQDPGAKAAFHIPNLPGLPNGANEWLEFTDKDTDLIKAPVINDSFYRYYFVSPTQSPHYNTLARIRTGDAPFVLGIPTPNTTPTVVATGGTGTTLIRAYLYTWLSAYGEESAPSPAFNVSGHIDTPTWTVTLPAITSGETANRNITKRRIYRTVTGTTGVASFFFVADIPVGDATFTDTLSANPDSKVAAGSLLPAVVYYPPPSDLAGWVALPNGIIAGFTGNDICFCEPYLPHAWPPEYRVSVEYPIVGLGVIGNNLVACTKGFPAVAAGNHPSVMTFSKVQVDEPCLSKGSIVSAIDGVYYASVSGLIKANPYQVANITKSICDRDKWNSFIDVANIRACRSNDNYFAFSAAPSTKGGLMIDTSSPQTAFVIHNLGMSVDNVMPDVFSTKTLFISGGQVYEWDAAGQTPARPYTWKSKKFVLPFPDNFAAGQIMFDASPALPFNTPLVGTLGATFNTNMYMLLNVYADDRLVMTREIRDENVFRLPGGFKATTWQFEVTSQVTIHGMVFATSIKELRA